MILAVTGGKGGVGKSTVAYNLGAALDAVVVDADLSMADLPTGRGPDLHDVLADRAAPHEAIDQSGPVSLVPCGRTLLGARAADPSQLCAAIEAIARRYGAVVIDCPAGLSADAGLPLVAAEACLLVTTAATTAMADAFRTRALARQFDAGLLRIVLNKTTAPAPTDRVAERFGAPVVPIPASDALANAQTAGQPLCAVQPDATAVSRFETLAQAVHSARA
jgi:septum site-determining protein MinD